MIKVLPIRMPGNIEPMNFGIKETALQWKWLIFVGSNGRKAVPLALLRTDVTVFNISEENKRYAIELAHHASMSIDYIVGDVYDIDFKKYKDFFDILYLEGGILHYFNDIDKFMAILFSILKIGGLVQQGTEEIVFDKNL